MLMNFCHPHISNTTWPTCHSEGLTARQTVNQISHSTPFLNVFTCLFYHKKDEISQNGDYSQWLQRGVSILLQKWSSVLFYSAIYTSFCVVYLAWIFISTMLCKMKFFSIHTIATIYIYMNQLGCASDEEMISPERERNQQSIFSYTFISQIKLVQSAEEKLKTPQGQKFVYHRTKYNLNCFQEFICLKTITKNYIFAVCYRDDSGGRIHPYRPHDFCSKWRKGRRWDWQIYCEKHSSVVLVNELTTTHHKWLLKMTVVPHHRHCYPVNYSKGLLRKTLNLALTCSLDSRDYTCISVISWVWPKLLKHEIAKVH